MSLINELEAAAALLEQAPKDIAVAYLFNQAGYANIKKLAEKPSGLRPISTDGNGGMYSTFSGIAIYLVPGLAHSLCLYADGSTKPLLT